MDATKEESRQVTEEDPMEETQEHEEDKDADIQNNANLGKEEQTAEGLMTDMKLEDETDYIREMAPDSSWLYHIEVFPWTADDMTDNLIKIVKLASFSHLALKKKRIMKQTEEQESLEDTVQKRQRQGCLHLYVDTCYTAKTVLRSITWKSMIQKELTIEVTRRCPKDGHLQTAYFVADTYLLSKIRFRDKIKGELKDRSAKISNIPGTITREFLDVVFSRAHVVYDDSPPDLSSNTVKDLQVKLQEMDNFNGSFDLDCFSKASCRFLVLAYKSIFICGQKISMVANNEQTMEEPVVTEAKPKKKTPDAKDATSKVPPLMSASFKGQGRGRGRGHFQDGAPFGRGFQRDSSAPVTRGRGVGRASMASMRPASASFPRSGHGMPVPMTGRQKMNEKLRRLMNPGPAGGAPVQMLGAAGGARPSAGGMGSVGDSFKHEIASLQSQIARNTQVLEARIARLQQESTYYDEDVGGYDGSHWNNRNFDFEYEGGGGEPDFMYDSFRVPPPLEEFGSTQNQGPRYQTGFSPHQRMRGGSAKGTRRGASQKMRGNAAASTSPRGRGSDFQRGGKSRNVKDPKNEMAWSDADSIFW